MSNPPLFGTQTHPLSKHALGVLKLLSFGPEPQQRINPGVVDRLMREDLARTVQLPSPFAIHRGGDIRFLEITDAGRAALKESEA